MRDVGEFLDDTITGVFAPQPIVRLELVRMIAPFAILGFVATRMIHADDWLSSSGFRLPSLAADWRQPASLPALAPWAAWLVCAALAISGVATMLGAFTRVAAGVFAVLLAYVALADRMEAFTVSKLAPMLAFAMCVTPAGSRWSIDAWRWKRWGKRKPNPRLAWGIGLLVGGALITLATYGFAAQSGGTYVVAFGPIGTGTYLIVKGLRQRTPRVPYKPPTHVSGGCVRFFQIFLPVFYFSSGLAKIHGDWLSDPYVLWTQLHDSYQTPVSWWFANHLPSFSWTGMQATTLAYEVGAPLWFALRWTRPFALVYGLAMHALIGMMFGPVTWFALLMMGLLVAAYAPATLLDPTLVRTKRK